MVFERSPPCDVLSYTPGYKNNYSGWLCLGQQGKIQIRFSQTCNFLFVLQVIHETIIIIRIDRCESQERSRRHKTFCACDLLINANWRYHVTKTAFQININSFKYHLEFIGICLSVIHSHHMALFTK